jgi:hypothetical protein
MGILPAPSPRILTLVDRNQENVGARFSASLLPFEAPSTLRTK